MAKKRTCHNLGLDLKAAEEGKTWLLLPEGFRDTDSGKTYPLPSEFRDVCRLHQIIIPMNKRDAGCIYLRRAYKKYKTMLRIRQSATMQINRNLHMAIEDKFRFKKGLRTLNLEAQQAVNDVREQAEKAIASLNDLFSLGRKGLDGMMKAHLDGTKWRGEKINANAFRQCFRMITQAVKGLGVPSEQREKARETVMEEVARSVASTQDVISLNSDTPRDKEPPTEH